MGHQKAEIEIKTKRLKKKIKKRKKEKGKKGSYIVWYTVPDLDFSGLVD